MKAEKVFAIPQGRRVAKLSRELSAMNRWIGEAISQLRRHRPALHGLLCLLLLIILPLPLGISLVRWLARYQMPAPTTAGRTAPFDRPLYGRWRRLLSRA